ncbi:hypothetical protein K1719_023102 [Acacia pycnantha]|nr:hypothetical protein K1719_023102 [Acacia pycnantha]
MHNSQVEGEAETREPEPPASRSSASVVRPLRRSPPVPQADPLLHSVVTRRSPLQLRRILFYPVLNAHCFDFGPTFELKLHVGFFFLRLLEAILLFCY